MLDGEQPMSSVSHVVCLLFPYNALGAELLSWAEVGVVVAARTGRAFSAEGVLYPCGVYALDRMRPALLHVRLSTTAEDSTPRFLHRFTDLAHKGHPVGGAVAHRGLKASILSALEPGGGNVLVR